MRLRKDREPSPETAAVLDALDAALAGQPVDHAHSDMPELVAALRAERPQPRPEFELALDLRAREGFQAEDDHAIQNAAPARRRELHAAHRLRTTPLAIATAASLFIVATAVFTTGLIGGGNGGSDSGSGVTRERRVQAPSGATPGAAAPSADSKESMSAPSTQPVPPPGPGIAPRARERRVERSAELTLATPRDRIEDIADGALRVTDRHGGFVLSSSVASGEGADAGASLDLRIPADRLQAAVADLSELAHVRARRQAARDITAQFTSPQRRLADALAERRGLLRQLARADTPNETAAVRARLRATNRRIDRARGELRRLRERVTYAAVSVSIEPGGTSGDTGGGGWGIGDAAHDALTVLGAVAGGAIVALAVAVPAGLLAVAAWLSYRAYLRHRRERALDAAARPPAAAGD